MTSIYLDYNASTPIDPSVTAAMRPYLDGAFGNPSSGHWASMPAKAALEKARSQVAALLDCATDEIVFTSGGSEANNLAIKGTFFALRHKASTSSPPRSSIRPFSPPCRFLEQLGAAVTYVPVDSTGRVDPEDVRCAITPRTILISVMHANNEVGTIQPIYCAGAWVRFHTDAAQSVGKIATKVDTLGVDLLTIAGHKLYAPKGVGALYVRGGLGLEPLIHGAGHEHGRRAGTESALLAVGLGLAVRSPATWCRWRASTCCAIGRAAGEFRRPCRTQRAPSAPPSQHAQRFVRRHDRCRGAFASRGRRGVDRFGLSRRPGRALPSAHGHGRAREDRHGCRSLQSWSSNDRRRNRRHRGSASSRHVIRLAAPAALSPPRLPLD